jgi:hypothetical protein
MNLLAAGLWANCSLVVKQNILYQRSYSIFLEVVPVFLASTLLSSNEITEDIMMLITQKPINLLPQFRKKLIY